MSILLRLLLIWLALAVAVMLWRSRRRQQARRQKPPPRKPQGIAAPQPMVACAHCALLLPRGEALLRDGRFYCCREHMQHMNEKK